MKRLLSIIILLVIFPLPGFSEPVPHEDNLMRPSPITTFHEIWDIPWDTTYEEFADLAFQHSGITFQMGNEQPEIFSVNSKEDAVFTFLDVPVKRMSSVFTRNSGILSSLNFVLYIDEELSLPEKLDIFKDLYHQLATQYGQPSYEFLTRLQFCLDDNNRIIGTENFYFGLPMNELEIDVDELMKLYWDGHSLFVHALFDNLSLNMAVSQLMVSQRFDIYLYAASYSSRDYPSFLPPVTILPYEQFATFPRNRSQ